MAIFDCIIQLDTLYTCVIGCTNNISQMARTYTVLPQRWAIIIDAVTTLKQPWPSSHIASRILSLGSMFPGQTVPSDCGLIAGALLLALMSKLGGCRTRGTCVFLEWCPKYVDTGSYLAGCSGKYTLHAGWL